MKLAFPSAGGDSHTIRWVNAMAARGHGGHLLTMHTVSPATRPFKVSHPRT